MLGPPPSPRLTHCPAGLPAVAYHDAGWHLREMAGIFGRDWVMAGRLADLAPGTMRREKVGSAEVILCRSADGHLSAFHNSCRHRGAELCNAAVRPLGRRIACPYHGWAYAADDGRLLSTAHARPTADFRAADHGLVPLHLRLWAGFIFLSAAAQPPDLWADVPLTTFDNWPMADLQTAHRHEAEIACNWKVFWENYSECLHCPGIHPGLCAMVPVYRQGVMAAPEQAGWAEGDAAPPALRPGAESWTPTGAPCGPAFPGLTDAERRAGHSFVTLWPSAYVVAHVDYVRSVRLVPLSPTRTRLIAEWHFAPETLAQDGFDAAAIAAFAQTVLDEDAAAAEMNQRGLTSPAFAHARLMPEEYEIHRFHRWVLSRLEMHA